MNKSIVIDIEMCRVSRGAKRNYGLNMEIIQIGAVLLDENYQIIDQINMYVKPEYGKMDGFIHKLTGIQEDSLYKAHCLQQVLEEFAQWIPDGKISMVSWSMSDRDQLVKEMNRKGIVIPKIEEMFEGWIDAQMIYGSKVGAECGRQYALSEALVAADIAWEGDAHNGYYDAYNTALLYRKLMSNVEFTLNSFYLVSKQNEIVHLTMSIGDIFSNIDLSLLAI